MLWEWRKEVSRYKAEERWLRPLWKPKGKIGWALVYPNYYEVGISNLGFLLVYELLSLKDDIFTSRFFKWDGFPPLSFEEGRSLREFEIVTFSLSYELDMINLISILSAAGIHPLRWERKDELPLVGVGGVFPTMNPLPLFPIADFIVCGEAENVLERMIEVFIGYHGLDKRKILEKLVEIDGVLVPGIKNFTKRTWVKDLEKHPMSAPLYTVFNEFGGALLIELSRGCKRSCLFCPVKQCYKPVRYRSLDAIKGFLEEVPREVKLGLISSVATDYPLFDELLDYLLETGRKVSFGSFRVEGVSEKLLVLLKLSDQRMFTLAPETANEDLRKSIGKPFPNELMMEKISMAYGLGFRKIKLYFMVGLPGEELENVREIGDMIAKIKSEFRGLEVVTAVSPFVPKPFTPFESERFLPVQDLVKRMRLLRKLTGVEIREDGVRNACLEAVIARGDEKLGETLCFLKEKAFSLRALEKFADVKIYLSGEIGTPWREVVRN